MTNIKVRSIFAAVFEKSILDPFLKVLNPKSVRCWGTEGTVKYLIKKGFSAKSVISGFDFDGRVKSLDRAIFARILADRTNKKHLEALRKEFYSSSSFLSCHSGESPQSGDDTRIDSGQARMTMENRGLAPFDLVVVDLYAPRKEGFPESMDIGGQALIRAAIKNYQNVVLAFDKKSIRELVAEIQINDGSTTLTFRKKQADLASKFIAQRCILEAGLFQKL